MNTRKPWPGSKLIANEWEAELNRGLIELGLHPNEFDQKTKFVLYLAAVHDIALPKRCFDEQE